MHALHLLNTLPWPLSGGRRLNAHHLACTLVGRGHRVTLLLRQPPDPEQLATWPLRSQVRFHVLTPVADPRPGRRRRGASASWMKYWGVDDWIPAAVAQACERLRPDSIEAIGLDIPLWLTDLPNRFVGRRLWFAGDDPSLLHRTMIRTARGLGGKMAEARRMLVMRAYGHHVGTLVDDAVTVSPADAQSLRRTGAFGQVLMAPNGVDQTHYQPSDVQPDPRTAVFWGRLDFPPNAEAIGYFARRVWPDIVRRCPGAVLRVVGPGASPALVRACSVHGIELLGEAADIRPWIHRSAVAVMPMRSGAGIKNKLLEAAAMARPIVASPHAVAGLTPPTDGDAWRLCEAPEQWERALVDLWRNPTAAERLGAAARRWVAIHHDWTRHAVAREVWLDQRLAVEATQTVEPAEPTDLASPGRPPQAAFTSSHPGSLAA